jgi:hypothetical protein
MMLSPSKVIAWECGLCTYTNKDATHCNCMLCQTRCLVRYAIVAGAMAATARTKRVDHCKQACIASLAAAAPAIAGEAPTATSGAITGEAPTAANGPPAVAKSVDTPPVRAPQFGYDRASVIAWQHGGGGSGSAAAVQRRQSSDSAASAEVVAATAAAAAWRQLAW